MYDLSKIVSSFLLLGACSFPPQYSQQQPQQNAPFRIIGTPSGPPKNPIPVSQEQPAPSEPTSACPVGMSNIEDLYCIDRYEAVIVDKDSGKFASPHYIPSKDGIYNSEWQFTFFENLPIPSINLAQLIREKQPISMPVRGAEQFSWFAPTAVSQAEIIPASYLSKVIAEQACGNSGKRLCTRKEWYKVCVGPEGPSSYLTEEGKDKGKEIFPKAYPYGADYEKERCNLGLQTTRWPPGLLGRKNNKEMLDPRIGALLGKDSLPMKKETNSFPDCTNSYGAYNMLGNVHEIVSDIYIAKRFPKERVIFVGSHYARNAKESCAEATTNHWGGYSDYSIGFRCCMDNKK